MRIISVLVLFFLAGILIIICAGSHEEPDRDSDNKTGLITLTGPSEEVTIGDRISLSGRIDDSLYGSSPSDVVILISAPKGSHADTFILATPASNGTFKYSPLADVGGEWGFEALYTGIYSDKVHVFASPGSEPKKTALTLSGWPTYPQIGDTVSFKGRLTDGEGKGIAEKEIVYQLTSNRPGCMGGCGFDESADWYDAGSVGTDINGEYFFSLPVIEKGKVLVATTYEGDEGYSPSTSRTVKISVNE
ncbi:MAG: hypothetical protein LUQ07_01935 [Methanospirillum sp.]|nr:hypothetical protein [Methanospirillum sp.]